MFKPQDFLVTSVASGELKKIRVALSTYLSKNPTNEDEEITNVLNYVQQNFDGNLWEVKDERVLEQDSSKWTKDYLAYLKSDLRNNFSKERFDHIIEVGKVVRKKKTSPQMAIQFAEIPQKTEKSGVPRAVSINRNRLSKKGSLVLGGLVLGGLLLATYLIKK